MTATRATAPAKINLTLHITGQRDDGYHTLDSLVVFADVVDQIVATSAPDLRIDVSGPFSGGVPTDETNIVIRAAETLRRAHNITAGANIALEKHLPHAAGIGSGSSDAAAALRMLAALWNVPPLASSAPEALALGADVPVCMRGPGPIRMSGIGEVLSDAPALPDCALVLVNPCVAVPTAQIFAGLKSKTNRAMDRIPDGMDFDGFADWLAQQRNDLMPPAVHVAPQINAVLNKLGSINGVEICGMSGSGATCFGLMRTMSEARQVARALQIANGGWWIAPAQVMRATT